MHERWSTADWPSDVCPNCWHVIPREVCLNCGHTRPAVEANEPPPSDVVAATVDAAPTLSQAQRAVLAALLRRRR